MTAEVCNAFLAATGLPKSVMQPAFGMAEACTCMTYNNSYCDESDLKVSKDSMQLKMIQVVFGVPLASHSLANANLASKMYFEFRRYLESMILSPCRS